ncbi:unknown protein [Simkania negevensis Z]|uniref:Uncharacterized protein n=1 Tax=Simkania negevensis (strain ATCC VR-1471 / DSM 27360 / Z) TaxID=331113 RepID=F8L524_SIMNZ|nr:unknown protein [Simkania negevensis Z]
MNESEKLNKVKKSSQNE